MENSFQDLILALDKTTYPRHLLEIVVVDNGSSKTPRMPKSTLNLILLHETKPGSYAARNTALKAAKGVAIAFTDADCVPEAEWLLAGVTCLLRGADRVAGNIELVRQRSVGRGTYLYQEAFAFDVQADLNDKAHVATANMFTWKHVLDRIGPFDESAFSGGDKEWSSRFLDSGLHTVLCPEATVLHPARSFIELVWHRKRLAGAVRSKQMHGKRPSTFKREFVRGRQEAIQRVFSSPHPFSVKLSALIQGLILFAFQIYWSVWFAWLSKSQPPRS